MRTFVTRARRWVATRHREDNGANMTEYGLLVMLIALVAVGTVNAFGAAVPNLFVAPW